MSVQPLVCEFRNDDSKYLKWLVDHPDGYVINIVRTHSPAGAKVHRATCRTISGQPPRGRTWTGGDYVKVCADHLPDLDQWAKIEVGPSTIPRCGIGTCDPKRTLGPTDQGKRPTPVVEVVPDVVRFDFQGSAPDNAVVQAWADHYIRFENLPPWQQDLRQEIRSGCGQLTPAPDEVMHARFFGEKHPRADVENLVLYNIDTFNAAGRNGIRFEHGDTMPSAPGDAEYRYCYSYSVATRADSFSHWSRGDKLASFDWTNLAAFSAEKRLAQVWWALARGKIDVFKRAEPETPFGLRVEIRPPDRCEPVWGGLVKGVFDGVICAMQNYTDPVIPPEVLERLAEYLPPQGGMDDIEQVIERLLRDPKSAVLGGVPRLVYPYQKGVKWDPSDHFCVAGELLATEPEPGCSHWEIRGEVFELSRESRSSGAAGSDLPIAL